MVTLQKSIERKSELRSNKKLAESLENNCEELLSIMKKAHDENLNEEWSKNNSVLWKKFKHKRNNQSAH